MKTLRLCLLSCLTFAGCAVLGRQEKDHPVSPEGIAKVQKGMTEADVTQLLGAPQEILFIHREHDPERVYAYVYENRATVYTGLAFAFINFGNVDEKRDRAVVFFDQNGQVKHVGASLYAHQASFGFPFGN
jgi:outer membrane protein assembly factor BamE (lipoprotein component of BamABCDE complex)